MRFWNRKRRLADMLQGYRATCLIVTAVRSGVLESLAAGPARDAVIAAELGAHPTSLRRFLVALAGIGLVSFSGERVALTAMGRTLLKDERDGQWHMAVLIGEQYLPAWSNLRDSLFSGRPAFERVFGTDAWEHRRRHPDINEAFTRLGNRSAWTVPMLAAAFDFSTCDQIVDVGGNQGQVLVGLLARYPRARGVVFDLPHVVAGAADVLVTAGLADRCRAVGGSFFEAVPRGGDVYVLGHVLHDWDDDACLTILRNCRAAMRPSGALLIVEYFLPPEPGRRPLGAALLDMHMLAVLGGKERTRAEFETLLRAAGFDPADAPGARAGSGVLRARPSAAQTPATA